MMINGSHVECALLKKAPSNTILTKLAIICWNNSRRTGGFVRSCRQARARSHRYIPLMYLRSANVS